MDQLYPFERALPEELGLSSRDITAFIRSLEEQYVNMHGFMIIRHGKVAAEGYWKPFHKDYMHRMYSCSKSFTSTAIGILIGEGKLKLNDPVAKYFPDLLPENPHPYKLSMTVRDLLMMATPYESGTYDWPDKSWVATFFQASEPTHPAGSIWHYDTSGTHTLGVLAERLAGMPLMDFLYDRLFQYMGGTKEAWCIKAPEGNSWGGSGVICKQRDLARLAYVWMNKGRVGDRQIIPEDYVMEGSSKQIDNCLLGHHSRNHHCGYGYQVWMEPEGGFSFWGMASQYAVCYRDKGLMLICTANTLNEPVDEQLIYNAFREHILHKAADTALPADAEGDAALQAKLDSLEMLVPYGDKHSDWQEKVSGITYDLIPNRMGMTQVRFDFFPNGEEGVMTYTNAQGEKQIRFGMAHYVEGRFPQWGYSWDQIGTPSKVLMRCLGSAGWVEPNKLQLTVFLEDIHCGLVTNTVCFLDDGRTVSMMLTKCGENCLNEYYGNTSGTARE